MPKLSLRDLFAATVVEPANEDQLPLVKLPPAFWIGTALFYAVVVYCAWLGRADAIHWLKNELWPF